MDNLRRDLANIRIERAEELLQEMFITAIILRMMII